MSPRFARRVIVGVGAMLSSISPCEAWAQRVLGVVHDSTAGVVLPGAIVSIVDSLGGTTSRTTADGSGRFSLTRSASAIKVRVIRIGYQPRTFVVPASSRDTSIDVALIRVPSMLGLVRVSDRALCPGSSDGGPALQLWEQARAGAVGYHRGARNQLGNGHDDRVSSTSRTHG